MYADRELIVDLERFVDLVRPLGDANSLAQTLVKLVAPGVPDVYQGTEIRDDSLVDPDNRRPVDYATRRALLARLRDERPGADLDSRKLWTLRRVLHLRRKRPELWTGEYRPILARGPHAERVFAFARGDRLTAVVPRLTASAVGWRDTLLELPPGTWREILTERTYGGMLRVAALFEGFPVALLERTA